MARRRSRLRRNPTALETGLIAAGTGLVAGIGTYFVAAWGCNKLLENALRAGILQPGPAFAPDAPPFSPEAVGLPGGPPVEP